MKLHIICCNVILAVCILLQSCKKDNFDAPQSKFTGRLVYNGQPLGVRSNGVSFELWQKGYQLFSRIPLNIAQDGSFSALLFDGDYQLVRAKGAGPWVDVTDTIPVKVSGATSLDIPVEPYYTISDVSFVKDGAEIKATFSIQTVNASKTLELVRLYIGPNLILDQNNNSANKQALKAAIDVTKPIALNVTIPAALVADNYLFARVGVKTTGVAELLYSTSTKVQLK